MEIVIGTKAWSTWSLRPWLVLKKTGAEFTETLIQLRQQDGLSEAAILKHSPSGLVPALKEGVLFISVSLAICVYLAERFPKAGLWPADPAAARLRPGARRRRRCTPALRPCAGSARWTWPRRCIWRRCQRRPTRISGGSWPWVERPLKESRFSGPVAEAGAEWRDRRRLLYAGGEPLPHLWLVKRLSDYGDARARRARSTANGCWSGRSSWRGRPGS